MTEAHAQTSSIIGYDTGASTQYECLRFGDPKLNVVRTSKGGRVKTLKISAAKTKVTDRIEALKTRKISLKDLLRDAKAEQKKLTSNPLSILHPEKLDKAKKKVETLMAKVSDIGIQIENLKHLLKEVGKCSKPADPKISGTIQFLSGLYNNGTSFYVVVAYIFNRTPDSPSFLCADVSGQSGLHSGWSQIVYPEIPYTAKMLVTAGLCFRLGFECFDPQTQGAVAFASTVGPQAPGSCLHPADCSLDAALQDAHSFFDGIIMANVVPYANQASCVG